MNGRKQASCRIRVPPGLEEAAEAELFDLGLSAEIVDGGVLIAVRDLPKALLWSRIGSGITVVLGGARIDRLPDSLSGFPWHRWVASGQRVEVVVRGFRARGLEKKAAAVIARHAARTRHRPGITGPCRVWLIQDGKRAVVAVEAARDLYKRGWRTRPGRAPLRENLAAGVLRALNWSAAEMLVDPMCGSGTFAIEATGMALGRGPGAYRRFACEWWPSFDGKAFEVEKRKARAGSPGSVRVACSDRDARQLACARENAKRARVERHLHFAQTAFEELEPPAETGLVVINPPYGHRIQASERTYHFIGGILREWHGWRYGILLPDVRLARTLPGAVDTSVRFRHGGKQVWLAQGSIE